MNNESVGFTYTDANIEPNTITFNSSASTWVMQITADRKIIVNEDVEVSEAAQAVLDAMQPLLLKTHPAKTLTNEEILCLWDWWSGEILSTDILDFADTYKRALLGEEGLVEWHQEYVKKMNKEHDLGIAEAIGFDKGYTAATAKTLTDEEILEIYNDILIHDKKSSVKFAKAILKKASEK
jgi:hypothetical protein